MKQNRWTRKIGEIRCVVHESDCKSGIIIDWYDSNDECIDSRTVWYDDYSVD